MRSNPLIWIAALSLAMAACGGAQEPGLSTRDASTSASENYVVDGNTPGFVKNAKDLGPVDPATVITVTAWLKLHNENQLDQLVKQQQTKGHANFHHWLTQDQFNAQFSPTAQEVKSVQNFLQAHKLTPIEVAENNFYVKAQGSVDDVEKAFHVQLDSYSLEGATFRANTSNPSVNDSSGNHIAAITGLDDYGFQPKHAFASAGEAAPAKRTKLASVGSPNGFFFEGGCFRAPETHTFTGGGNTATYTGNRWGADITSSATGHLPPCGYGVSEVRKAYNIDAVGLKGEGETIVIVDAYGSDTIQTDAAVFSSIYRLPAPDITEVKAQGLQHNQSWKDEVTLDVEWAHAIAPAAKIFLVTATNRSSLDEAINLAVVHHFGNTISNSWSTLEGFGNPAQFNRVNRILEMAAAQGIDVNFSSGDDGDERFSVGFVDFPGSSPFATSIGGTSLALSGGNVLFETGWGTNLTRIAEPAAAGSPPVVPPNNSQALGLGFQFGAGGGPSLTYAKPSWQSGLPGSTRQTPDIGMLADPFTGVEIIETVDGELTVGVIGGTSLSCPLFSGLMALAAQKAGHGLGQAAPLLYGLGAGIRDVKAVGSASNVHGTVNATPWSADQLAAPLFNTTTYYSALYNSPFSTRWFVITFGTDTGLTTGPGWDNVTGLGVPDGAAFVNAIGQ